LESAAEVEGVPIIYHDGFKALNEALWSKEQLQNTPWGNWAVGCYRRDRDPDSDFKPEIHLSGRDVWTLAHELGHHLAIKINNDTSEEMAEVVTSMLANKFIPWWQRMFIPIEISVYAPKNRIKLWEKKKMEILG